MKPPWRNGLACWTSNSKVVGSSPTGGEWVRVNGLDVKSPSNTCSLLHTALGQQLARLQKAKGQFKTILTTLTRDIQCESLLRMRQSVVTCTMYPDREKERERENELIN